MSTANNLQQQKSGSAVRNIQTMWEIKNNIGRSQTAAFTLKDSELNVHHKTFIKKATANFIQFKTSIASRKTDLSFMWIVIVVLLILYVGVLVTGAPGIGGMIHLLLALALILGVLWLLRIL